ncbi:hypothetical protein MRX96_050636, partial [Rhipicephalus microplus]
HDAASGTALQRSKYTRCRPHRQRAASFRKPTIVGQMKPEDLENVRRRSGVHNLQHVLKKKSLVSKVIPVRRRSSSPSVLELGKEEASRATLSSAIFPLYSRGGGHDCLHHSTTGVATR